MRERYSLPAIAMGNGMTQLPDQTASLEETLEGEDTSPLNQNMLADLVDNVVKHENPDYFNEFDIGNYQMRQE